MDWQRGQDAAKEDDVAAETFGNLITSASGVQSIKVSTGGKAIPKLKSTATATTTQRSNYAKTLHKIDGILSQKQHNDDTFDGFVDDISDYEYEDVPEDVEEKTMMKAKGTPRSSSRLQFGKSLNGNLRSAGKTVVRPSANPSRISELELEFKESSDSIEASSSSITPVIDDYNQTDSSTTTRQHMDGEGESSSTTMLTTLSGSDNDDIVEIDTSSTPSTERAMPSTIDVIENDFQIKKKQKKKLQTELEQKPVVDDNNNERDLADNYEGNNNNNNEKSNEGQSEPPPQSINQTVAELMLSDAAHFDDNDDIDIVKLGGAGPNNQSHEVDLYKTAAPAPKAAKLLPPASENEVLKEEEQQQLPKVAHLTPLKPYVSERYDRPSKRILVNVTIATDDDSDSIYTLHVAVPTGGGSHDVEQMLTHEKKQKQLPDEDNNIDSLGACVPEPPPRMPDCPCSCLPPPPPIIYDELPNAAMSMTQQEAVEKDEPLSSTTNTPSTVYDNNNIVTSTDTVTASDSDNVIDSVTDRAACPDVMPILILEGDCTVSAPANPTSNASD